MFIHILEFRSFGNAVVEIHLDAKKWALMKKKKKKQLQGAVKGRGVVARRVYRRRKKVYLFECLRWCQRLVSLNDCPIFQGLIVDTYKAYPWPLCIFNAHGRSGLVLCTRVPNYLPPPPSIKIPDSRILDENKTSWTRYPLSYSPITLSPLLSLSLLLPFLLFIPLFVEMFVKFSSGRFLYLRIFGTWKRILEIIEVNIVTSSRLPFSCFLLLLLRFQSDSNGFLYLPSEFSI